MGEYRPGRGIGASRPKWFPILQEGEVLVGDSEVSVRRAVPSGMFEAEPSLSDGVLEAG
jgi:hypothetical protein